MNKQQNLTEIQLKTLSLFTRGFNSEYYVREVAKHLSIAPRTAQLTLEDLERKTVLQSKTRGKIKIYQLQKHDLTKRYLALAETYKTISFLEKHNLLREITTKIAPHIEGMGLLFGSYVKSKSKKDSDLDVLVIGKANQQETRKISKTYNLVISIKEYPSHIFKRDIEQDILIKEILKNHIIFQGAEEFINKVLS